MARAEQPIDMESAGSRLIKMRPMEVGDNHVIADWYRQIEDVSVFDRQIPVPVNGAEVARIVEGILADQKKEKCYWLIAEDESGEGVGMIGLELINQQHGNAILPLFIAPAWRRTGVGIRMAAMMLDIAFLQLRLHRVGTVYRADNGASDGLVKRLGFTHEGVSRQAWYYQGHFHDVVNVGLIADEWMAVRDSLRQELNSDLSVALGPRATNNWCWP